MTKLADPRVITGGTTVVGVFPSEVAARDAVRMLEGSGMPPDRIGVVVGNVRQAREVAGSYSLPGGLAGAGVGVLLIVAYLALGGEAVQQSAVAIVLSGLIVVAGLAAIGALAGRARVFKDAEYAELEDDVAAGDILVSVTCDTPESADEVRAMLERGHAVDVRLEDTKEVV